jgi:hypothetical protein
MSLKCARNSYPNTGLGRRLGISVASGRRSAPITEQYVSQGRILELAGVIEQRPDAGLERFAGTDRPSTAWREQNTRYYPISVK